MNPQGLYQVQKQTQTLVLAPQLRQSLKILQTPALELRTVILEELQINPALEELPMDSIRIEEENSHDDAEETTSSDELDFREDYQALLQLDEDWNDHFTHSSSQSSYTAEDDKRRKHFFDSLTNVVSLQEHLMEQAKLTEASSEVLKCLEYLIGSLNDRGFLPSSISDLSLLAELPLKKMQEAHRLLKTFDPVGIGTADLQDCLLTQLKIRGETRSLPHRIIKDYFDLLLRRRIPEMARRTGKSIEDVQAAIEKIASLDPSPASRFSDDTNRSVAPDVKVIKDDGNWQIILNNEYIPRLRLSSIYKNLLAKGTLSAGEKDYIREKIRSGRFLINSIEQRQNTIERITREILNFQNDFFEEGVSKLRPLTMHTVAESVGVHETTVSRAIANKYIETPHGLFEFKYFFTPGYTSRKGQALSNKSIKDSIAQIFESEDLAKPFSDQEIVKILAERDIKIARRTVAKYREEMGVLSTNLRRRYR